MTLFLALVFAQAATAASDPASTASAITAPGDMKIVCRSILRTGSRLNAQRVCLTKRDWRRMGDDSQQTTRSFQDQPSARDLSVPR